MARYIGSKCKKCRQLGFSVCGSDKCALMRKNTTPGMHPYARKKMSDYKRGLLEKQKLRFSYWISEKQFRNYMKKAYTREGITSENLLVYLERRLDSIVYRLGFAPTIPTARQIISHDHILVNGHRVNIPSYSVKIGDEISLKEESRKMIFVEDGMVRSLSRPSPSYLEVNKDNLVGKLTSIPVRNEIPLHINENLVVEYYTKYISH